jgi:hypothetical protein
MVANKDAEELIDINPNNILISYKRSPEGVREIDRVAIADRIESVNVRGDRDIIERHSNDAVPHYFSGQGSLWRSKFADLQRANPLGPQYLGDRTDLDVLCAYLIERVRPRVGLKAVLHILMPSVGPLAMVEAVKFPDAMRPFIIDGQLGNGGSPMVWLCTPEQEDKARLRDIGT